MVREGRPFERPATIRQEGVPSAHSRRPPPRALPRGKPARSPPRPADKVAQSRRKGDLRGGARRPVFAVLPRGPVRRSRSRVVAATGLDETVRGRRGARNAAGTLPSGQARAPYPRVDEGRSIETKRRPSGGGRARKVEERVIPRGGREGRLGEEWPIRWCAQRNRRRSSSLVGGVGGVRGRGASRGGAGRGAASAQGGARGAVSGACDGALGGRAGEPAAEGGAGGAGGGLSVGV